MRNDGNTHLHTVIAVGITQELLEASSVQKLADQHLARVVFGHTDALCEAKPNENRRRKNYVINSPSQ